MDCPFCTKPLRDIFDLSSHMDAAHRCLVSLLQTTPPPRFQFHGVNIDRAHRTWPARRRAATAGES